MGSGGAGALAVWAATAWSLREGRLGDNKLLEHDADGFGRGELQVRMGERLVAAKTKD
jgi:hypothetical protein